MASNRTYFLVAVHIFFINKGKILLLKRQNTGYGDGQYSVPAGHVDGEESIGDAMIRETFEETNVKLDKAPEIIHVMHRVKPNDVRIDYFGLAKNWHQLPTNKEPEKCTEMKWFPLDNLPRNTIPYIQQAIHYYQAKQLFSDYYEK